MDKWYGKIGFASTVEIEPGLWESKITERQYFGDVINNRWRRQNSGNVNDDINITNEISIVADPYAMNHCSEMVYVEYMGTKWKVNSINPQYPRLVIDLGGVWNGNSTGATE